LAGAAYKYPDTQLGILFLPGIHLSAGHLVPALATVDVLGLIFRWRIFDHGAHLTGAAMGLLYTIYGIPLWSKVQEYFYMRR
jgi:rhomboid-like protein